jgi:hypothetical protein
MGHHDRVGSGSIEAATQVGGMVAKYCWRAVVIDDRNRTVIHYGPLRELVSEDLESARVEVEASRLEPSSNCYQILENHELVSYKILHPTRGDAGWC